MQGRGSFQNSTQRCSVLARLQYRIVFCWQITKFIYWGSLLNAYFLPTFLLENLNVYFSTLNASSLQGALTYPLLEVFAVLWRKKEKLRQWRMLWLNFTQGLIQLWKKHCFLHGQLSEVTFKDYLIQCHSQRGIDTYVRWGSLWHYWAESQKLLRMEILCLSEPCHLKLLFWLTNYCPVWIFIFQALKRCNFHCIIQPIFSLWAGIAVEPLYIWKVLVPYLSS